MNRQNTVKIHTAKIDNHIKVIALDVDEESLQFALDYGEVGYPYPYIRIDEAVAALKTHEPRTDSSRVAFIEGQRYDVQCTQGIWYIYDNETKESVLSEFDTWTQAVDALMDMQEGAL